MAPKKPWDGTSLGTTRRAIPSFETRHAALTYIHGLIDRFGIDPHELKGVNSGLSLAYPFLQFLTNESP